jgi:XTP/dITP diphosphohydrolase
MMGQLRILIATRNKDKSAELREALRDLPLKVIDLDELEKKVPRFVENGKSFRANAVDKAFFYAEQTGMRVIADDSGLEVEFLRGAPGVVSARYAGPKATYKKNNRKVLKLMEGVAVWERGARFSCVLAYADPTGELFVAEGECVGRIAESCCGKHGFGYDPLFIPDEYDRTFGELGDEVKAEISHRAVAVTKMRKFLDRLAKASARTRKKKTTRKKTVQEKTARKKTVRKKTKTSRRTARKRK